MNNFTHAIQSRFPRSKTIISDFRSKPYIATFFTFSVLLFVFGFLLLMFTQILSGTQTVNAAETKWVPINSTDVPVLEVHIARNGMVLLRGAQIESIEDKSLVVSTTWNSTKMLWTITTNESYYKTRHFGTSFFAKSGERLALTDFKVGDIITVSGVMDVNSDGLKVKAEFIR